jgi:hypothetical protein
MISERVLDTEIDQIIKLPMHKTVRALNIDAMEIAKFITRTEIGTFFKPPHTVVVACYLLSMHPFHTLSTMYLIVMLNCEVCFVCATCVPIINNWKIK